MEEMVALVRFLESAGLYHLEYEDGVRSWDACGGLGLFTCLESGVVVGLPGITSTCWCFACADSVEIEEIEAHMEMHRCKGLHYCIVCSRFTDDPEGHAKSDAHKVVLQRKTKAELVCAIHGCAASRCRSYYNTLRYKCKKVNYCNFESEAEAQMLTGLQRLTENNRQICVQRFPNCTIKEVKAASIVDWTMLALFSKAKLCGKSPEHLYVNMDHLRKMLYSSQAQKIPSLESVFKAASAGQHHVTIPAGPLRKLRASVGIGSDPTLDDQTPTSTTP